MTIRRNAAIETTIARAVLSPPGVSVLIALGLALYASITLLDGVEQLLTHANDNVESGGADPEGGDEDPDDDDDSWWEDLKKHFNPEWFD